MFQNEECENGVDVPKFIYIKEEQLTDFAKIMIGEKLIEAGQFNIGHRQKLFAEEVFQKHKIKIAFDNKDEIVLIN